VVTYETVDGVVLPTSWMRTCDRPFHTLTKPTTTQPKRHEWGFEQILWIKNRVNMDVPAKDLTLAAIGVRPIDKFIDPRINQRVEVGPIINDPQALNEIVQAVKGKGKIPTSQPTTPAPTATTAPIDTP